MLPDSPDSPPDTGHHRTVPKTEYLRLEKDDISGFIYCKDCISDQNPKGELFVFTKTSGLRLTEINIENVENLKFLPLDKPNMEKAGFPENGRTPDSLSDSGGHLAS